MEGARKVISFTQRAAGLLAAAKIRYLASGRSYRSRAEVWRELDDGDPEGYAAGAIATAALARAKREARKATGRTPKKVPAEVWERAVEICTQVTEEVRKVCGLRS